MRQELEERSQNCRKTFVLSKPEESNNFKYTGCKTQFEFNQRRINTLELVDEYLKFGIIEDAREILKSTRELVEKTRTCELRTSFGDSLADGPDEATKLRKAEFRAIKRKEKVR